MSPQHYYRDPDGQCQRPYFGGTFSSSSGRPSPSPCSTPTPPPYSRTTRNMSPIKSTIPSQVSFFFLWGWFYYFWSFFLLLCVWMNFFIKKFASFKKEIETLRCHISQCSNVRTYFKPQVLHNYTKSQKKNHNKNLISKVFFSTTTFLLYWWTLNLECSFVSTHTLFEI